MIEATLKGKLPELENREDVITSTVFGLLKYKVMREILKAFIGRAVLYKDTKVSIKQDFDCDNLFNGKLTFNFWRNIPEYGQPDLIVEGADFCFIIEVKYGSGLSGEDQLKKYNKILDTEYRGMKYKAIIFLSADLSRPRIERKSIDGFENRLYWLTWYCLYDVLEEGAPVEGSRVEIYMDLLKYCKYLGFDLFKGIYKVEQINFDRSIFWGDTIPLLGNYESIDMGKKLFWAEG